MKCLMILTVLSLSQLACGPIIPMEEQVDDSSEAVQFKKNVEGVWQSECRSFTDGAGKPVSLRKQFNFKESTAKITEIVFSNYSCAKPAKSSESYDTKMIVAEATSDTDVVVEFTNQNKREGHFLRERTRVVFRGNNGLYTNVVGRSYVHDGKEEWMNESDYDHDREYTFSKINN
jgi:hypothetical protein